MNHPQPPLPPEVVALILELKRYVDATAETVTGTLDATLPAMAASVSAQVASASAQALDAEVAVQITVDQVNMARAWLEGAAGLWDAVQIVAVVEGAVQFADRLLGIGN